MDLIRISAKPPDAGDILEKPRDLKVGISDEVVQVGPMIETIYFPFLLH